ncbi:MAG: AAA family ATPase [Muribaculaceae bacterium]|nr:AAA family ATPase [Muribaculaceae bacterium]
MKITSINVTNYRSIRQLDLQCKPRFNVIAGVNGAGKSTLLSAIEIMLSWVKARIRLRTSNGAYPDFSDISKDASQTLISITANDPHELKWEIARVSPAYRGKDRHKSELTQLTEYADSIANQYHENPEEVNLPMFVKYSVNRSLIDIPTHVHKKHILDAMSLYEGKIDGGSNLRSFFEWFREREDIEREERDERQSFSYEDPQLKAVRKAISEAMNGYGDLHTRRKKPTGFELRKNGEVFRVEDLSDGEKCYLTLIGDIARRLAICNPALDNPLDGVGIVLIDELELHLHPSWQSEAIDKLRSIFPNCQFFITTHSPHIVQNLRLEDDDSLTVLDNGNVYNVDAEYGSPVNKILSEVFGLQSLRPKAVQRATDQVWSILAKGAYKGEELDQSLSNLKALISDHDPEFADIKRQIALNKRNQGNASDQER